MHTHRNKHKCTHTHSNKTPKNTLKSRSHHVLASYGTHRSDTGCSSSSSIPIVPLARMLKTVHTRSFWPVKKRTPDSCSFVFVRTQKDIRDGQRSFRERLQPCVYVCMYVCVYVCVCIYVYVSVYMYVCMFIVCTYTERHSWCIHRKTFVMGRGRLGSACSPVCMCACIYIPSFYQFLRRPHLLSDSYTYLCTP